MSVNPGQPNASSATGTRNRVSDPAPYSGICAICLDGCPGFCEVGKSSFRGREVVYPGPLEKLQQEQPKSILLIILISIFREHVLVRLALNLTLTKQHFQLLTLKEKLAKTIKLRCEYRYLQALLVQQILQKTIGKD